MEVYQHGKTVVVYASPNPDVYRDNGVFVIQIRQSWPRRGTPLSMVDSDNKFRNHRTYSNAHDAFYKYNVCLSEHPKYDWRLLLVDAPMGKRILKRHGGLRRQANTHRQPTGRRIFS